MKAIEHLLHHQHKETSVSSITEKLHQFIDAHAPELETLLADAGAVAAVIPSPVTDALAEAARAISEFVASQATPTSAPAATATAPAGETAGADPVPAQ